MDISKWLGDLGLGAYVEVFHDNDIDARVLTTLIETDLLQMGVRSVGHRRKLLHAIALLNSAAAEGGAEADLDVLEAASAAERRQLSVLYCDIGDGTASAGDPEQLRDVITAFHGTCTRTIDEFDGHVANFHGQCMSACFGWPRAHEDDAERTVRAGLALVQRLSELRTPTTGWLAVRVGIATGPVVVAELLSPGPAQEQSAVGETPNLGARLQALAEPGQVVIDETTMRRLGGRYVVRDVGRHMLKGIARPVAAFVAEGEGEGEGAASSRFDAHAGTALLPMVGRDQELALLRERWSQARSGEGTAVLLVGEAGIGKSRLMRALLDACAGETHERIRWQCSPYHSDSALWPVVQQLRRVLGLGARDSADAALDRLEALLTASGETLSLLAALLDIDGAARYGALDMTSQMQRTRTLEVLVEQLFARARKQPVLLVIEDAHWSDPTTLLLVDRCLDRIESARMLMLVTSRPENPPNLTAHTTVTHLTLNRLGRAGVEAIVARLGGDRLLARTRSTIAAHSDGVPLFVEELTKAVLESGEASIPASLQGSLTARLERVPEVKEVAQIAACIGRDFDYRLLLAVADRSEAELGAAIDTLVAAELIFRRGDSAHCSFKHTLVQEATYQSLLRSERQHWNAQILAVLEAEGTAPPELLGHYAERAEALGPAVDHWQRAGVAALAKSAYAEAASYLGNAAEALPRCADGRDRRVQELELQVGLGQALGWIHGQGAQAVQKAYGRARELLDRKADKALHAPVTYGLWAGHHIRAEHAQALSLAHALLADAHDEEGATARLLAHRMLGASQMFTGALVEAREHSERAIALLDSGGGVDVVARRFAIGPMVYGQLATTLCLLGCGDRCAPVREQLHCMASLARDVMAKAWVHLHCAVVGMLLRDPAAVEDEVRSLLELTDRHRLRFHQGIATMLLAWVARTDGRHAEAVTGFERALHGLKATDTGLWRPFLLAELAQSLAAAGRLSEAHHAVEQAIVAGAASGEVLWEAELWRVRGDLLVTGKRDADGEAVRSLEHALQLAGARDAKLWELRAATSLARLRADQGDHVRASDILAPVCAGFTNGAGTADFQHARALLDELQQRASGAITVAP